MKYHNHKIWLIHKRDLKVKRGDPLEMYYPWVDQIARTFSRDSVAIGALNYQDLLQAGYEGLVRAWNQLDHDKEQAQKWTYIKKRIKWSIRREIDKYGSVIATPINKLEDKRNLLQASDKILVNVFGKFFDSELIYDYSIRPWKAEILQDLIDDYLYSNIKNIDHVEILRARFGIDRDKPVSAKNLAKKYNTSEKYIGLIVNRLKTKLRTDEKFIKIIENYDSLY